MDYGVTGDRNRVNIDQDLHMDGTVILSMYWAGKEGTVARHPVIRKMAHFLSIDMVIMQLWVAQNVELKAGMADPNMQG